MKKSKTSLFPRGANLVVFLWLFSCFSGGLSQAGEIETINLSYVVEKVLANSPEVLNARDAVETAKLNLSFCFSGLSPEVTLSGNWPIINGEDTSDDWGINIKDAVYLFDKSPTEKTAQILLQEAESQLLLEEEAAKVQAVTYYFKHSKRGKRL